MSLMQMLDCCLLVSQILCLSRLPLSGCRCVCKTHCGLCEVFLRGAEPDGMLSVCLFFFNLTARCKLAVVVLVRKEDRRFFCSGADYCGGCPLFLKQHCVAGRADLNAGRSTGTLHAGTWMSYVPRGERGGSIRHTVFVVLLVVVRLVTVTEGLVCETFRSVRVFTVRTQAHAHAMHLACAPLPLSMEEIAAAIVSTP